jgi:hypothetical protein
LASTIVIATSGRIERKHGNTKVAALRKEYGPSFAKGRRKDMMLKTLLAEIGSAGVLRLNGQSQLFQ